MTGNAVRKYVTFCNLCSKQFGMLLDVTEAEEHVITRKVYASARSHTEPRAAILATRGVGTDSS